MPKLVALIGYLIFTGAPTVLANDFVPVQKVTFERNVAFSIYAVKDVPFRIEIHRKDGSSWSEDLNFPYEDIRQVRTAKGNEDRARSYTKNKGYSPYFYETMLLCLQKDRFFEEPRFKDFLGGTFVRESWTSIAMSDLPRAHQKELFPEYTNGADAQPNCRQSPPFCPSQDKGSPSWLVGHALVGAATFGIYLGYQYFYADDGGVVEHMPDAPAVADDPPRPSPRPMPSPIPVQPDEPARTEIQPQEGNIAKTILLEIRSAAEGLGKLDTQEGAAFYELVSEVDSILPDVDLKHDLSAHTLKRMQGLREHLKRLNPLINKALGRIESRDEAARLFRCLVDLDRVVDDQMSCEAGLGAK